MIQAASQPCPECGTETDCYGDCPGYEGRDGRVMVCMGCGNADTWYCPADGCGWWYRHPNGLRSDEKSMGKRPDWLEDGLNTRYVGVPKAGERA